MKKVTIELEYNDKLYKLDTIEATNDIEYNDIRKMIELAASGKLDHLTFTCKKKEIFFPQDVLSESVITMITN